MTPDSAGEVGFPTRQWRARRRGQTGAAMAVRGRGRAGGRAQSWGGPMGGQGRRAPRPPGYCNAQSCDARGATESTWAVPGVAWPWAAGGGPQRGQGARHASHQLALLDRPRVAKAQGVGYENEGDCQVVDDKLQHRRPLVHAPGKAAGVGSKQEGKARGRRRRGAAPGAAGGPPAQAAPAPPALAQAPSAPRAPCNPPQPPGPGAHSSARSGSATTAPSVFDRSRDRCRSCAPRGAQPSCSPAARMTAPGLLG
jgi:hypothetical protein